MVQRPVAVAISLACAVLPLLGQYTSSSIRGTVTDQTGAAIVRASVIATNNETNVAREVRTDAEGRFGLDVLPVGAYSIRVAAEGFRGYTRSNVTLQANRVARVDAVLGLGNAEEAITIVGEAPTVNTDHPVLGRTLSGLEITHLPLVDRNVYSLLNVIPGVESSQNSVVLGYPEQRTKILGGTDGGAGTVGYYLDGGSNMTGIRNTGNNIPNPDAVAELAVNTNSFSAEYGGFSSGIVNVITKSGSNQIHGSAFEFLRNDKLNANLWSPAGAPPKAPQRRNQYGVSLGGPLRRDRAFFFGTWSGLRQIGSTLLNTAVVPTLNERNGVFRFSSIRPTDPDTGQPFPDGIIPLLRFDKAARNILERIPMANRSQSVFQGQVPSSSNSDEYLLKIDLHPSARWHVTGSYFHNAGTIVSIPIGSSGTPVGNLPWSTQQLSWRQHNANLTNTWNLGPSAVNQLWFTFVRNFGGRLNLPTTSLGDLGSKFQIQGTPGLPQIGVSGYFTLGQAIAGPTAGSTNYSIRNLLSVDRNGHLLRVGGEAHLNKDILETLLNNYGVFNFTGIRTGNALADFMLGLPVTMNQDAPVTALDDSWSYGLFVQDDWRIHRDLTLNLGLRWDLQTPPTDPQNRQVQFVPGARSTISPTAPRGMLFPGDPGVQRGIAAMRTRNFGPRIGFAWDPFGDRRTSIRAGAGVFYGSVSGNEWNTNSNFQPFSVRQQFNNVKSLSDPYALLPGGVSPYPYSYDPAHPKFINPAAIFSIDREFLWPYTYQFNFSIQREVIAGWTFTAAYVGSLGRRLPFAVDINYPLSSPTGTSGNVNARRPIEAGTLASILMLKSIMNTSYQGLQLTLDKRLSHHLSLKSFYTFSRDLSGAQLDNNTTQGGVQDFSNLRLEKGRSDFDRRHNFVTYATLDFDYYKGTSRFLRQVTNGWALSLIASFRSGAPFTVNSGRDNNVDGNNNDRPDLIGDPRLEADRPRAQAVAKWFNTGAFLQNAAGRAGNAGRNILDGPGLRNLDLAAFKDVAVSERIRLQVRGEFTNVLNLVNLSIPNAARATTANLNTLQVNSPLFGQVRDALDMRQVQVGLRLLF